MPYPQQPYEPYMSTGQQRYAPTAYPSWVQQALAGRGPGVAPTTRPTPQATPQRTVPQAQGYGYQSAAAPQRTVQPMVQPQMVAQLPPWMLDIVRQLLAMAQPRQPMEPFGWAPQLEQLSNQYINWQQQQPPYVPGPTRQPAAWSPFAQPATPWPQR